MSKITTTGGGPPSRAADWVRDLAARRGKVEALGRAEADLARVEQETATQVEASRRRLEESEHAVLTRKLREALERREAALTSAELRVERLRRELLTEGDVAGRVAAVRREWVRHTERCGVDAQTILDQRGTREEFDRKGREAARYRRAVSSLDAVPLAADPEAALKAVKQTLATSEVEDT